MVELLGEHGAPEHAGRRVERVVGDPRFISRYLVDHFGRAKGLAQRPKADWLRKIGLKIPSQALF